MVVIGYARVSSAGQSLDVQLEKLAKAGCTRVYKEKRSGRQAETRPELQAALGYVREGDVLVVSRLDRVARSVLDLAKIADLLNKKGVSLRVLDQGLDTSTSEGKLMFNLLGAFAEFEADIRAERQRDGIALAQQKGIKFGRKKALTEAQEMRIRKMRAEDGFSIEQLAERFSISRSSVYRHCRQTELPLSCGNEDLFVDAATDSLRLPESLVPQRFQTCLRPFKVHVS
jgi:DNA invertase Pin-like site-specific DNA recombinase